MIEDSFIFRYPINKLNLNNENIGDADQIISMEYIMRSEQEATASVFLKGYQDTEAEIDNAETLKTQNFWRMRYCHLIHALVCIMH